jgi:integrase
MATLRVFIRWCESIDGVPVDLHTKVVSPELSAGEGIRDTRLQSESAEKVLARLEKYYYAELGHVTITLLWRTMMRRVSVIALDVDDYNADEQYLTVKHRPETGTQLKNGENGERFVALRDDTCTLLDDWLADRRPDVSDEHGREPLLATKQGRPHPTPSRRTPMRRPVPARTVSALTNAMLMTVRRRRVETKPTVAPQVSAHTRFGVEESLTAFDTASPRRQSATARTQPQRAGQTLRPQDPTGEDGTAPGLPVESAIEPASITTIV